MIEFRNTSVSFRQKKNTTEAVRDVSLTIEKGTIYGIVGGSGAGKSTLLRTINRLQPVTGGDVLVNGESIIGLKGSRLRELRKNIGMIFQHFNLASNKTVFQNIAFMLETFGWSRADTENRVTELLRFVNIPEKRDEYPSALSGGQKQRVAIARALANNADILLCDEPTSALDAETTLSVLELLRKINRELGVTVVIITHELDVVKSICSRVAVMENGRVVEEGDVYDVFSSPKSEFTRLLIKRTQNFEIPEGILSEISGDVLKITYRGESAVGPVLSDIARETGADYNILHGKIEYINGIPLGILYVNILGSSELRETVREKLREKTSEVEVLYNV
ncbi:MAG: ATP-binding cassette domain-containing protein [Ruminococcus sp.]|nr:ATP-binding cassette domain-containing protein [Ruminococcus sp.]